MIAGKYRIERVIGEGGMGIVLSAKHVALDENVALKFLKRELAVDADLVARFTQEARDAVKLKSEYVGRTLDVGVDGGLPFIVMEFLEGHDLGRELELKGTLPIDVAAEYMIQACAGVAAAHARGIVHRDIKPENLFLAERGDGSSIVKILDFGISKAIQTGGAGRSPILGSPFYMSPEQLRGGDIDYRSDIWSLGAVLFELLAGVHAFDTDQPLGPLLRAVQRDAPRKLTDYRPMAPPELEEVVAQCLAKDPAARIQSAAELSIALLRFAPKRARVPAERASSVTRAAGLSSEANLALPPSTAPPPTDEARTSTPAIPAAAELPTRTSVTTPSVSGVTPEAVLYPASDAPEGASRKKTLLFLAAAAAALLLIGLVALTRSGTSKHETTTATLGAASAPTAPSVAAAPSVGTLAAPSASAADPSPAPSGSVADAPDDPASASAPAVRTPRAGPPYGAGRRSPTPSAPTPAPPSPSRPDLDIRMTR